MNSYNYYKVLGISYRTAGNGRYEFRDVNTSKWNFDKNPKIGMDIAKDGYQVTKEEAEKIYDVYHKNMTSKPFNIQEVKPEPLKIVAICQQDLVLKELMNKLNKDNSKSNLE